MCLQILFIAGVTLTIGLKSTISFFLKPRNYKVLFALFLLWGRTWACYSLLFLFLCLVTHSGFCWHRKDIGGLFRTSPKMKTMLGMGFYTGIHIICSRLLPSVGWVGCFGDAGGGLWLLCSFQVVKPFLCNAWALDCLRCISGRHLCYVYSILFLFLFLLGH